MTNQRTKPWLGIFLTLSTLLVIIVGFFFVRGNHPMSNSVHYFEIPVSDMDRAIRFYSVVFGYKLDRQVVDGYDMALFPRTPEGPGASGALAKGDAYVPTKNGAIIYFTVDSIDAVLERAKTNGGGVLYPKKSVGELGFVAEIEDSEGNRIALHSARAP